MMSLLATESLPYGFAAEQRVRHGRDVGVDRHGGWLDGATTFEVGQPVAVVAAFRYPPDHAHVVDGADQLLRRREIVDDVLGRDIGRHHILALAVIAVANAPAVVVAFALRISRTASIGAASVKTDSDPTVAGNIDCMITTPDTA